MKTIINYLTAWGIWAFILPPAHAQVIPFTSGQWEISAQGSVIDSYEGEQHCILLQNGSAHLRDVRFLNGIIEFDVFLADRIAFPGVQFRTTDSRNYEEIYLRPHLSGKPDAIQYTPVFNGSTGWQLYHDQGISIPDGQNGWKVETGNGYNAVQHWHFDRWTHVKIVVAGQRADVYFDHAETPTLQVRELKRPPQAGTIGIKTAVGPVYFANFSYQAVDQPVLAPLPAITPEAEPGLIRRWEISASFPADSLAGKGQLKPDLYKNLSWNALDAEASGLVNIARITDRDREKNAVLVKLELHAERDMVKRMDFGYSDAAQVFCNGQALYSGDNRYRSRDYRYLGTIGFFDSVYLPLRKGNNTVVILVSESFGGWGVQAKLENMKDVQVVYPD
ncbi:MAG: hypothetical protein EP344_00835 [Bacteroidetes bacterium]|nr:MAG: hypothetical protein EP344_00835 [Bacteroidota bacterium]